ncbi:hypothetical protein Lal_00001673 [Lupinus albus]|nr:hypothetical protein Lal_00001673 [Lupinus albus]
MKTRGTPSKGESGKSKVSEGGEEQVTLDSVALGDMIWIKLRHGSWWPAQVVDAKSVNKSMKPRKRSSGEVLILKNNNYSYRDILQQSLEKDLPSKKSSRSKGSSSESKGLLIKLGLRFKITRRKSIHQHRNMYNLILFLLITLSTGTSRKRKSHPKDGDDLDSESPETAALVKSQELSTRRVRVMASLGLIAPTGSPFHKDGHNSNQN